MAALMRGLARLLDDRLAAPPDPAQPTVLVLMDRWDAFEAQQEGYERGALVDVWRRFIRLGPSVGMLSVTTGPSRLVFGSDRRGYDDALLLRQVDRADFTAIGLPMREVPLVMPGGRGIRAGSLDLTQVALVSKGHSRAEQDAALALLTARAREQYADLHPGLLPPSFTKPV